MSVEYICNGQAFGGSVANRLLATNLDPGALRPWVGRDNRTYIQLNAGVDVNGKPKSQVLTVNAPATLRKDEWIKLDETILRAARPQLQIWSDLVQAGLTYNVPNGMGVTVLQHQTMTDAGEATVSMDGLRESLKDRPLFDLAGLPLPITHSDFNFSLREIMVSRQNGSPLDMTMAEQASRKVAETIEKMTLGALASYSYGGYTVYGLTNHPNRIQKSLTLPTDPAWVPGTLMDEVLGMVQASTDIYFNGPWGLYFSPAWSRYLEGDYSQNYAGDTLRTRLAKTNKISFIRTLDYLTGYQVLLVSLRTDVIRAITGMQMTTLQWESNGGLQLNFKVMAIMVPQVRANSNGQTGLVHGVAA